MYKLNKGCCSESDPHVMYADPMDWYRVMCYECGEITHFEISEANAISEWNSKVKSK